MKDNKANIVWTYAKKTLSWPLEICGGTAFALTVCSVFTTINFMVLGTSRNAGD